MADLSRETGAIGEEERKAARERPFSSLLSGVSIVGPTSATHHTQNVFPAQEAVQHSAGAASKRELDLMQQMREMEQRVQETERRMQLMQQQADLFAGHRTASNAAETLPTPFSSFRPYPSKARAVDSRRLTFGVPSLLESPYTPVRAHPSGINAADSPVVETVPSTGPVTATVDPSAAEERAFKALKDAVAMAKGHVEPFYADTVKDDGNTVIDFVEKMESVMGDCFIPQHLRLSMVRWFLRAGALRWMNSQVDTLSRLPSNEGRDLDKRPFDWDTELRTLFIKAHAGTDTVELWLAKLSTLKLAPKSNAKGAARTPIELESQFDAIARHVYPHYTAGDNHSELLLAEKYSEIILRSQPEMYSQIVYSTSYDRLTTLKHWKEALVHVWNATERIKAATSVHQSRSTGWPQHRGRSGYIPTAGRGTTTEAKTQSVSAADTLPSARKEGQTDSPHSQLTAANSGRGGRGGQRGRGRGAGRSDSSQADKEKRDRLYVERKCFKCEQVGHVAARCPNTQSANTLQPEDESENEEADQ